MKNILSNNAVTLRSHDRTLGFSSADTDLARGVALMEAAAEHHPGDSIIIGPGAFEIPQKLEMYHNSSLHGCGLNLSSIRLSNQGANGQSCCIVMSKDWSGSRGCHISDILFDCNMQNQSAADLAIGAIDIHNFAIIERCRAVNWATKGNGPENFVFIVGSSPGEGGVHGGKFLNCFADSPAQIIHGPHNSTLFDFWGDSSGQIQITPDWAFGCEIAGCVSHDIVCGPGIGQPRSVSVFTTGQSYGFNLHDNLVYNITKVANHNQEPIVIYSDTFSIRNAIIKNNIFLNVVNGLFFQVGWPRNCVVDRLLIEGNTFDCNHTGNGWALVNTDDYTSISTNWTICNNYLGGYFQLRGTGHRVIGNTIARNFNIPGNVVSLWQNNFDDSGRIINLRSPLSLTPVSPVSPLSTIMPPLPTVKIK